MVEGNSAEKDRCLEISRSSDNLFRVTTRGVLGQFLTKSTLNFEMINRPETQLRKPRFSSKTFDFRQNYTEIV